MNKKKTRGKTPVKQESIPTHLSGTLHATGASRFISDEPKPDGMCYARVLTSPYAHAEIVSIDALDAARTPGVLAVLTAADIPGANQIGSKIPDEPLLPTREVCYCGQPVAVVVAETPQAAASARKKIRIEYRELEPVLTVEQALAAKSFLAPEIGLERGNVDRAFAQAEIVLEGTVSSGAQEHVYWETQRSRAVPGEDQEITIYSATQAPTEVQELAAHVLGLRRKDITVDVRRLGGAFGGKESLANLWACLTALACFKTKRPVELQLSRAEDMAWTGKRHPFENHYKAGFDRNGKILAYSIEFNANGGAYADLTMPIIQRAVLHAENAYYIPHMRVVARPCRTNLPPNTAFRGFGAPQGIFAIESVLDHVAHKLEKDPLEIRRLNAYRKGQQTPYGQPVIEPNTVPLLRRLEKTCDYASLLREVDEFNETHPYVKRGIGILPIKFGISFTAPFLNQGSSLIHVYTDGSVSVSHGGVEMGQEVNTKVAQAAASELGVTLDRVRIETHNTKRTANTSPTAASTGADLNGNAARDAARQIIVRLRPFASVYLKSKFDISCTAQRIVFSNNFVFDSRHPDQRVPLSELAHAAWMKRIDLAAHGFYKTPGLKFDWKKGKGTPFAYFVFGCGLAVAEVDLLTGYFTLPKVYLIHETARSVNPAVDRGQIEGAFFQGFGWCTMEEVLHDGKGRNITPSLTTYKIPTIRELPDEWQIEMVQDERRQAGLMGSKAVGEPPFLYGQAVFFAIKHAIESLDNHHTEAELRFPATPESIVTAVEKLRRSVKH
ncbi:xanthine dehydrogenase molybdopterin binding subunit [candidate division KSB1 bacterium]|nr:MAG: xanthine dehydrogenase molybdopterin binding subunit [candidate division KSB1 bacterium]